MKFIFLKILLFFSLLTNAQFQENIIESVNYNVNSIVLADIDNDNDNDLIVSGGTDNQLKWYENSNGLGNFDIPHGIFESSFHIGRFITISDIDSDDDIDILATISEADCGEVSTFKNINGQGDFQLFSSSMGTCGLQSEIAVADINQDNHNDWVSSIAASQINEAKVSWFENDGNGIVTEHIIEDLYLRSFQLVDIDNDNDYDLVGFNIYQPSLQQLFWYENTNSFGNFSIKHPIVNNPSLDYYSKIIATDLDQDGDKDIIVAYDNIISWFENDGQGNFSPENIINNDGFTKRYILSIDLDADGEYDIISTGDNNSIMYYRNYGEENFYATIIIENMYRTNSPIFAIDISGDNKLDIIASSSENGKIAWYENSWVLSTEQNSTSNFSIYPNPTKNIIKIKSNKNIAQLKIFNQLGLEVLYNRNEDFIDISSLSVGLYFIKAIDIHGNITVKRVIKN